MLYIGLAVDIFERFKQLVGCALKKENNGCKKKEIDAYFLQNKKLGYSIMVQSSLSQPLTYKVAGRYKNKSLADIGIDGKYSIKYQEGILLQLYKLNHNAFPKWNQVGGAVNGQITAKIKSYQLIQLLTELEPCKYVSRVSIQNIAKTQPITGSKLICIQSGFQYFLRNKQSNGTSASLTYIHLTKSLKVVNF